MFFDECGCMDARCVSFIQCGPQRSLQRCPTDLAASPRGRAEPTTAQPPNDKMTESTNAEIMSELRTLREEHAAHAASTQVLQAEVQMLKSQLSSVVPAAAHKQSKRQSKKGDKLIRDPFFAAALKRSHPMYVVKVTTLLAASFQRFRSHEELKTSGMLVEWKEGMGAVLFCSHTWLRHNHPDSEAGEKFALLIGLLRRALAGKLNAYTQWLASMVMTDANKRLRLHAKDLQSDLADGYVFFDYMSIPQADPEAQQRAVVSLGSYVSASSYFFVLAGPWVHENGSIRDDAAWEKRGWCRMELVANALSPTPKPMILAKSVGSVEANPPGGRVGGDWVTYALVGQGDFTVEADRQKLGAHLVEIIAARKALALADKDMLFYRHLHALTAYLLQGTGLAPAEESFDSWMNSMRFETVRDNERSTGLTPLFYAVAAGRTDLAEAMIAEGADVNAALRINHADLTIIKGCTALHYTGYFRNGEASRRLVEVLVRAGANTRKRVPLIGMQPLMVACYAGNCETIEALLDHDSSLIAEKDGFGITTHFAATQASHGRKALDVVRARFPAEMSRMVEQVGPFGQGLAGDAATIGQVDTLIAFLDDMGAPVNAAGPAKGAKAKLFLGIMDLVYRMQRRHINNLPTAMALGSQCTALHTAAFMGKLAHTNVLLERGADLNSTHHSKGMTPLVLAALSGHEGICARLLDARASPHIKDSKRRTALYWAKRNGHEEVTLLILSALRTSTSSSFGRVHAKTTMSATGLGLPKPPAQVAPDFTSRSSGGADNMAVSDVDEET